ncbi:amino acid permease [Planctomyces sp. SH-PL62]|uniref:amino acid permease n=1 Tax=Planctomyces sp. SH-PL62 TaxID=1636152 RepID=UPI00078C70C3|nr:amino acid permease [Planctomyces sp. SH-PL62]AMV36639.1 Putrescine importer PuuP [Planctomyces sp. SH-PL62]
MPGSTSDDVRDLAGFGYKQELDRSLGSFSSFAAGFSYISILTGVFQMFYLGYAAGGPAFFWTWPMVFLGQFLVALCFAELASSYPLSGGVYQWSKQVGTPLVGWLTGWVYLACSILSLAAVALALQNSMPQISAWFQVVGDGSKPIDQAKNAVLLGCTLIALTTIINAVGVRLMALINNVGVLAELAGVVFLIVLLGANACRGPAILLDTQGRGDGATGGYFSAFLAAAVMASYVLYGFDTAGTLAEETSDPRRRAPRAILRALAAAGLAGGLLILVGLLAMPNPTDPAMAQVSGGLPMLVKSVMGPKLGTVFLIEVVFAVAVCALAVHAGTVRLIFAMARDNSLPFAECLAKVTGETRTPIAPAIVTGLLASAILLVNVNAPRIIERLCSVALVWANLAYLMVTLPLLLGRLRDRRRRDEDGEGDGVPPTANGDRFSLGRWGLPVNLAATVWGVFVIVNMSWPRPEIYGDDPIGRYTAALATAALTAVGVAYYAGIGRLRIGVLPEHAAEALDEEIEFTNPPGMIELLAPGESS